MNFKQTIFTVLYAQFNADNSGTEWKEEGVKELKMVAGKVTEVVTESDKKMLVDEVSVFVRESTGMFDKLGGMLFGGDIVKASLIIKSDLTGDEAPAKEVLMPILWVNGAYCCALEELPNPIYLSQQNVMEMEKVGNIYQHGKMLEKPIDEAIFETTGK